MIGGAIFDVDGTILDSTQLWNDLGRMYLETKGIKAYPELGEILFPMTMEEAAAYMKGEYGLTESTEEIVKEATELMEEYYQTKVPLKKGVKEFLEGMKSAGARMVIVTSGSRKLIEAALERQGVLKVFEKMFTCDEEGAGKTQPDIYLKAAEYLEARPGQIWVFEDAVHAVRTAKAAGFKVAGVYDESNKEEIEEMRKICDVFYSTFCRPYAELKPETEKERK